jgi:signal transduction histidine kinase
MRIASRIASSGLQTNLRVASIATLVIVVLVLAVLQYRWIGELSDAHETRAQSQLRDTVRALIDAVDTEITRSALVFETAPAAMSSRFEELERRWDAWNQTARWPRIISGVALLESSEGARHTRWLGSRAASDDASMLRSIEPTLPTNQGRPRKIVGHDRGIRELIFDGQPALTVPLSAFSTRPGGIHLSSVLIRFDGNYLANTVFPQLLAAYSTADDRRNFQFELKQGTERNTSDEIVVSGVFQFRPDCLGARVGPRIFRSSGAPGPPSEPHPEIRDAMPLAALLQAVGRCQRPADADAKGLMQLAVRRQAAPMNAALSRFRWRNQIVSSLLLATLLVTMAVLVMSAERARKLARMQTVVAAGISHELRTPLASLRIAADDLRSGQVHSLEQARYYGEVIDAQSMRLGHVVDQALALAGATEGNGPQRLCSVSVVEIMGAAVNALSPTLSRAEIRVDRRTPADVPRILADPEMVLLCLTNLIENAIKYSSSGGGVFLSAQGVRRSGKSVVEVTVEDRGPGIDDDEAAAIFEPFYRGSSARHSRQPGSGLGLAIVKGVVESHGGWITLEKANPHGCRFKLFFIADEQAEPRRS